MKDKHSSLLGSFVSYKNEVLWIQHEGPFSKHFIFFLTYEWVKWSRIFWNSRLERLAGENPLAYWAICKLQKMKCCEYNSRPVFITLHFLHNLQEVMKMDCWENDTRNHIYNTSFTLQLTNGPKKQAPSSHFAWS